MQTTAWKRFERQTGISFQPTEDDFEILLWVYRRRLLHTNQIRALFPHRSRQKLGRRVTKLSNVGWLDKLEQKKKLNPIGGGSIADIFALANDGARALAEYYEVNIPPSRWTQRNKELQPHRIPHILKTSDFVVNAEQSARRYVDRFRVAHSSEILSKLKRPRPNKSKPLSFNVPITWRGRKSIRAIEPDELLQLKLLDQPAGRDTTRFMVEIDQDKETVEPSEEVQKNDGFWRSSSILKKYVIYANAFKAENCRPYGFNLFRVLMVTTTPTHMKTMQKCESNYLGGGALKLSPGFVLYTNWDDIAGNDGDVLAMPWQDRNGRERFLYQ